VDHRPRKRFGQHFLHEESVIRRIIEAIDPRPGERLVEIGPGLGALTAALLARCDSLDVVELDRNLAARLAHGEWARQSRLRVHTADALRFDFAALAGLGERLRVVGNLPYNISTPLLFHLLAHVDALRDIHVMLQKEVVDRLAASPGGKAYGRLSVMVQYRCVVEKLFHVGPGAFTPPPKVESAVVRLVPTPSPVVEITNVSVFEETVRRAFSHRRKTLRNTLKGLLEPADIEAAGVDPAARAGTLDLAQFAALSNAVHARRSGLGQAASGTTHSRAT